MAKTTLLPSEFANAVDNLEFPVPINGFLGTITTGTLAGGVVHRRTHLRGMRIAAGVTGTAGATTVEMKVNGVSAGDLTIASTDADGSSRTLPLDVELSAGDILEMEITAAPTAGTRLVGYVDQVLRFD